MFYTYNQNNSGGHFHYDNTNGITHFVIIEAPDSIAANERAEKIGLYFNGCQKGYDCDCCGDRWYPTSEYHGDNEPSVYGQPVSDFVKGNYTRCSDFSKAKGHIVVHYADGSVKWYT